MTRPKTQKEATWRSAWLRGRDGAVRLARSGRGNERVRKVAQYELRALRNGKNTTTGGPLTPLARAKKRGAVYQFTVDGLLGRNPTRDPKRKGSHNFYGSRGGPTGERRSARRGSSDDAYYAAKAERNLRIVGASGARRSGGGNKARAAFAGR